LDHPNDAWDAPPVPLTAWRDPAFLHLRAANLILTASLALFRLGLLPRGMLARVVPVTQDLARRAAAHRDRRLARRLWG